jgi:hypothetical protein
MSMHAEVEAAMAATRWVVLPGLLTEVVTPEVLADLRALAAGAESIFNQSAVTTLPKHERRGRKRPGRPSHADDANDHKRRQRPVAWNTPALQALRMRTTSALAPLIGPRRSATDYVLLHSLPGCAQQALHLDYGPADLSGTPDAYPWAMLLALEPDTRLVVGDDAHPFVTQHVTLAPGDMLLFRGDLPHAGAAYSRDNIRLHAYIDVDGVKRRPDTTYLVVDR